MVCLKNVKILTQLFSSCVSSFHFRPAIFSQKSLNALKKKWGEGHWLDSSEFSLLLSEIVTLHVITVLWPWLSYTITIIIIIIIFCSHSSSFRLKLSKKNTKKKHIGKQQQSFLEEGYQNYLATSLKGSIGSSQHSASFHNSCSVLQHPTLLFYLTHSCFPALQKEFPKGSHIF